MRWIQAENEDGDVLILPSNRPQQFNRPRRLVQIVEQDRVRLRIQDCPRRGRVSVGVADQIELAARVKTATDSLDDQGIVSHDHKAPACARVSARLRAIAACTRVT